MRGTKGARVVELVPERKLIFEWIAFVGEEQPGYAGPPYMPEPARRRDKTQVEVNFEASPGDPHKTRIILIHSGFRQGAAWDRALAYFRDEAWPSILHRLADFCDRGVLPSWHRAS